MRVYLADILPKLKYYIIYVLLGILLSGCQHETPVLIKAKNGSIDLSQWNFDQDGVAKLNGEWNFYWGSLISSVSDVDSVKHSGICSWPRFWTEVAKEDTYFEQTGFATYHLNVALPDTLNQYSLKLNAIFSCYALWENGNLLASVGKVGMTRETTIQDFETKLVKLPKKKNLDLFLQVANWEHLRGGGAIEAIKIGKKNQIYQLWRKNFTAQIFVFAIIAGISLYLIVLAFFYPEDPSYLYVGLFALMGALREICLDEMVIESLIENLSYFWNQRLRFISYFSAVGFITLAVNEFFKGYFHRYIVYLAYLLLIHAGLILITPFQWSFFSSIIFMRISIVLMISCIYPIYKTISDKKNVVEATLFMIGGTGGALSIFYTMLYVNDRIQERLYDDLGNIIFIFCLLLILAHRNRSTFDTANQLSDELSNLNKNLGVEVENRTEEINTQKDQIIHQAEELSVTNEKLKELDEAKNRFFANISHELRTPLTLILGGVSQVKKQIGDKQKDVGLIEKQANLLHQLIDQLLELTELETGKMELNKVEQPIIKLLKDIFYSFQSLADTKRIHLQFESNVDECYAYIDLKALERIVYNLLSNAHKFTPESGSINLEVNASASEFEIKVKDSGIGIPAKELPLIFNRFYQADTSLQKEYQGTGIGLALVKELVHLHNGDITVESTVGQGTQFTLSFPLQPAISPQKTDVVKSEEIEKTTILQSIQEVSSDDAPSILIVEDHPELLELITDSLQGDYQIIKARDGQQGLEMAVEIIPDIVISDVMMPNKDGYELCHDLKHDERTSHIPIILLTALDERENKIQGLKVGADDYLAKPFDTDELNVRVENLINNRKLLQEKFSSQKEIGLDSPNSMVFENPADQKFIDKLFKIFEHNLADEKYGVAQIAEELNISKRQLHRKITAISDLSPVRMLQNYRLQKAKSLLRNKETQIKEVAFSVGFANPSYFNKRFKEHFGITPKEFQASNQK